MFPYALITIPLQLYNGALFCAPYKLVNIAAESAANFRVFIIDLRLFSTGSLEKLSNCFVEYFQEQINYNYIALLLATNL